MVRPPSDPAPRFGRCAPPPAKGCVANVQVTGFKPGLVSLTLCLQAERKRGTAMAKHRVRGRRGRQNKVTAAKAREKRQAERDARAALER